MNIGGAADSVYSAISNNRNYDNSNGDIVMIIVMIK